MERKECPFCGERIQRDALKCRYCREWLSEKENESLAHGIQPEEQQVTLPTPVEEVEAIKPTIIEEEIPTSTEEILLIEVEPISTEEIEFEEKGNELQEEIVNQVYTEEEEEVEFIPLDLGMEKEIEEEITTEIEVKATIEKEVLPIITMSNSATKEEEEEEELIRWQKFKTNKTLAILSFILSCIATYFSYFESSDELTIRSIFWVIMTLSLDAYLLYQLYLYIRNFDVFYELQNTMKFMIGCYIFSLIATVVFFTAYQYMNVVWLILPILCVVSIAILRLVVGWKLWKRTDDFVGGLETFGLITFLSAFIPGAGILSDFFLYKVFANAQEHIEENGYLDDNEDDY